MRQALRVPVGRPVDDRLGRCVAVTAALAIPVIAYSMAPGLQTTGRDWIALALTLPAVLWGGWPIHRATWRDLRHGGVTMDTLITLGVTAALGWSIVALAAPGVTGHRYLEVAAGVTLFILLGRFLEQRAKRQAGPALRDLADSAARDVAVLAGGIERRVPLADLRAGDLLAVVFGPVVVVLALATFGGWLGNGSPADVAFANAVAVLIIAGPCALGLAAPMALLVGTGRGAQLGILIRGPEVLESARRIDTVVLDKTGTVTTGALVVSDVFGDDEAVRLAAAVEHASGHPIARALAASVETPAPVSGFVSHPGLGAEGVVEGRHVIVGRPLLLERAGIALPVQLAESAARAETVGRTAVAISVDGRAAAVVVVADTVRPTSRAAVSELRALGLRTLLLTGDSRRTASAVADTVGIREVISEVLPADKERIVSRLHGERRVVAMVGDGIDDAPALARAELGIAMGGGPGASNEAADITLTGGDLREVARAIRLARAVLGTIRGNLFWAVAYNAAAIPLAAAGLLQPLLAGAATACSSLFVVANSLRLRRFR